MASNIPEELKELLRKAKEDNLEELDLSWVRNPQIPQLSVIPDEVFEFDQVRVLKISYHAITSIPDKICQMRQLKALYLTHNQFWTIPDSIRNLVQLEILDISGNVLDDIPDWLVELPHLRELYITGNGDPVNLSWMVNMPCLNTLVLSQFDFPLLPEWLIKLDNLEHLGLPGNNILEIPDAFYTMNQLKSLDLSDNKILSVGSSIVKLVNLKKMYIENNPVLDPPLEVARKGLDAIKNYYRQAEVAGVEYLYEAKLLILGESGAGKTTLARKIKDPDYQLCEDTTKGISVLLWEFELPNGHPFRVNIWDFGGNEIYHATHQFFLTRRSLYALVADARREDTDFYYWLNIVELLSNKSPILIIKNEKLDRSWEIDERQLRKSFQSLKNVLAANLATNRGLEDVIKAIELNISTLPHIGTPLPSTWARVRIALEKDKRNYISRDKYVEICEQYNFENRDDMYQLSEFLHDLGICLHFREDPVLNNIVILKPKWSTDAVYRVLDNPIVINNLGCFTRSDLAKIWSEPEYADKHSELLQLMMNFHLCYKLPHSKDTYIAPQLLTINRPPYDWDYEDNLCIRYVYDFMPKGIVTQLIVYMHDRIENHEKVWRSGVILEQDETRAEVVEYYNKREIQVRLSGKHKKDLMIRIDEHLEEIHKSYSELKYKKLIPCNCDTCKNSTEPEYFPLPVLYKFAEDGRYIQCRNSYEMVNPRVLIDDVLSWSHVIEEMGARRYTVHIENRSKILLVAVTKIEVQAILKVFCGEEEINRRTINNKTYYDLGRHGGELFFMVQSEMGTATPGGSLVTIYNAVVDLNPKAVIMCGVAYGLHPDKQQLGDILIAKQVVSYEPQKMDIRKRVIARGDRVTVSTTFLDRLRSADLEWNGAKTHFGLVISGEKLINDSTFRDWLLENEPEAIGGEMEGSGLYIAAHTAKVDWIIIKGICDWADGNKDDDVQIMAATNAAKFVYHTFHTLKLII